MKKAIVLFAGLACIAIGSAAVWKGMQMGRAPVEARTLELTPAADQPVVRKKSDLPKGWLDEFTLTERSGKKVSSKDFEGKVWAASFFFVACPGECARQNRVISQLQKEYGPQGVTFVSITCDPENDTLADLREYATHYTQSKDQWLFLTHDDLNYVRRVGAEYFGVPVDKGTHGSRLILIDKWGNIRGYYSTNGATSPQEYAAIGPTLKKLLAEKEPPEELKTEGSQGDAPH